jgi:hypothetical protein
MASDSKRAIILIAEIKELQGFQMESKRDAVFGGWTRAAEDAYNKRANRLDRLIRELEVLDRDEESS